MALRAAGEESTSLNLDDATEVIRVAVALGHTPPVFAGGTVFKADLIRGSYEPELLGIFVSHFDATLSIYNYAVEVFSDQEMVQRIVLSEPSLEDALRKIFREAGSEWEPRVEEVSISERPLAFVRTEEMARHFTELGVAVGETE